MKKVHLTIPVIIFLSLMVISFSPAYAQISFKKITLSDKFVGEGVSVGDFNKDGKLDVAAGAFLWYGPDFSRENQGRPKW
jgi:hypothetical protein